MTEYRIQKICMQKCLNNNDRDECYRNCVNSDDDSFEQCMLKWRGGGIPHCMPNFFGPTVSVNAKYGDPPS